MNDMLSGVLPPVTINDQIACVEREIQQRRRVYPRLIAKGSMKQGTADEEIRRMEAVLETVRAAQEK